MTILLLFILVSVGFSTYIYLNKPIYKVPPPPTTLKTTTTPCPTINTTAATNATSTVTTKGTPPSDDNSTETTTSKPPGRRRFHEKDMPKVRPEWERPSKQRKRVYELSTPEPVPDFAYY